MVEPLRSGMDKKWIKKISRIETWEYNIFRYKAKFVITFFFCLSIFTSTEQNMQFVLLIFLVFHEVLVFFLLNHRKKVVFFFLIQGVYPPHPYSGPTTNKNQYFMCVFPEYSSYSALNQDGSWKFNSSLIT